MPVVTFDDAIKKPISPTSPTPKKGVLTFEDLAPKAKVGEIKEYKPKEAFVAGLKRKGAIAVQKLTPPIARQFLPEKIQKVKPFTTAEKGQSIATELGRQVGEFYLGGKGVGLLSKLPLIAKTAGLVSKIPKVGSFIAKTVIPEFTKGAAFGAIEADKPEKAVKQALQFGTFFAALPVALKSLKFAGTDILETAKRAGFKVPEPGAIKTKMVDLIRKRYSDIQTGILESSIFIRQLKKDLAPQQRELLSFIREKTTVPKGLNRPDLEKLMKTQGKDLKKYASKVGDYLDDAHKYLVKNYGDDVGFWEDYLPHLWDIPKEKTKQAANWFVTRNPHTKQRYIATLKEGIDKLGLKPKTIDTAEILGIYDQYKVKTVANLKFAKGLVDLTDDAGQKLVQRIDKAPTNWVTVDHPALRRSIGSIIGKEKEKALMLNKVPVKVHPDIAKEVEVVLGKPFSGQAARAADTINAFVKKANLSFSLFHHVALTETGLATPTVGKKVAGLLNPIRTWKAIRSGNYGVFKDIPLSKDAVKHGLQIGSISDVQVGKVRGALSELERRTKSVPVLRKVTKGIRSFNDLWDKHLWDYYHTSLKLYGYEGLVQRGLKTHPGLPQEVVKKEVAQFVNDTFGGQAWDLMLKNPKWQQGMHWLLLSPDWTLSTVRQALAPTGMGAVSALGRELRSEMGQDFWKKGIVYFWGGMNLLNKSLTEADTGKGRYMWENAPGHKTHLYIGKNPDGTEKYMRWGKQFRELPEFFINPVKKAWSKVSPGIRILQAQVKPHPEWQKEFADKDFWDVKALKGRVKEVGKGIRPYVVSGVSRAKHPLGFAFPVSKGMTPYSARKLFRDAIEKKDKNRLREVYSAALNNGLDGNALFKQAKTEMKSDITFEFKKDARSIIERLQKLGKEKGKLEIQKMKDADELTPELNKQLIKILQQKKSVREQIKKLQERKKE